MTINKSSAESAFGAFCSGQDSEPEESTSALMNDNIAQCPKCKQSFGIATVDGEQVYYCEPCRVSHPIPVSPTV